MRMQLLLVVSLLFVTLVSNGGHLNLTDLKCDHQINSVGIDNPQPTFSWKLNSTDQRNVYQQSYCVQVATSKDLLEQGNPDVWDSGELISDNSIEVKYQGHPLESFTRYYWQVKVGDNCGRQAIAQSYFETSVLNPNDWKAKWISAPSVWDWPTFIKARKNGNEKDNSPWDNCSPLMRKEFSLKGELESARLYVTGVGYFEAYVNGQKVGDELLSPAYTRYDKTVYYSSYDITNLLQVKNAIGLMLGNGWYNQFSKAVWGFDHAPWRGKPRAFLQLELVYTDGRREQIITDEYWKAMPGPIVFNSVRQGMTYDENKELPGWDLPGFDDVDWFAVELISSPGGQLRSQYLEGIRPFKELPAKQIIKKGVGHYLVDFGQNMAGWSRIQINGMQGDTVWLKYGEDLKNGLLDQGNIDVYTFGRVQTDCYILSGKGSKNYETKFTYHGFRYIEIEGYPGELTTNEIIAVAASTSFKQRGHFQCSDKTINKLQENTIWSYRSNYYSIPTDCPHREKNGWTGDAQLAVETGLWNFNSQLAYKKYSQDMLDEQQLDGNLPGIIPTSGWGYHWGNGPAWVGAYLVIPWHVYLYDGNQTILIKNYQGMKKLVSFLESKSENGILKIGLGDWAPFKTETPVSLTSTAYLYYYANILSQTALMLGKKNDQNYYKALVQKMKEAFNNEFYNAERGEYANGSQTAQSCALYMGLVDKNEKYKVVDQLVQKIKENGNHIDTGILGAKYLLHVLSDNGHANLAYEIVTNETFPSWAWWVKQGATTLWEDWDGRQTKPHSSLNHIMFGDISNWFYQNIAGIKQQQGSSGFKEIVISPGLLNKLEWSEASLESTYGLIKFKWEWKSDKLNYYITVPCNTNAKVKIPDGMFAIKEFQKSQITNRNGSAYYEIGSGDYSITFRNKKN